MIWDPNISDEKYKNPVVYADLSDPDIVRRGDDFYMVASSFVSVPALPIYHSCDLVNWQLIGYAQERLQDAYNVPRHGCGVWAPSIRYHGGRFYIYYGDPDMGIMMTSADDICGPWDELVCVKEGCGLIDVCPLWDDDGRAYLVHGYAKSRAGINNKLAVLEMTPDGKKALEGAESVVVYDGERDGNYTTEGPKFYKINGLYYILAPSGGVENGWQIALRSNSVYGPYECKTVMKTGGSGINGPHQGGLFDTGNGEWWFIHFRDLRTYGRLAYLEPVTWKEGWPVIGTPITGELCGEPVAEHKRPALPRSEFVTPKLQFQWQGNPAPGVDCIPPCVTLPEVTIRADGKGSAWESSSVLTCMWNSFAMAASAEVRNLGAEAALGVIGAKYGYVALGENGRISICTGTGGDHGAEEKTELTIYHNAETVRLFAEVRGECFGRFPDVTLGYFENGEKRELYTFAASSGKWVGAKFMFYAKGKGDALFSDISVK